MLLGVRSIIWSDVDVTITFKTDAGMLKNKVVIFRNDLRYRVDTPGKNSLYGVCRKYETNYQI